MKKPLSSNQQGIAHLAIILLAVVVLGAIGFTGWRVMQSKKDKDSGTNTSNNATSDSTLSKAELSKFNDDCKKELNDDDLCKFFSSWTDMKKFSMVSTTSIDGVVNTSTIKVDGNKTYMKTEGEYAFESITIDKTNYTKAGDTWWKQPPVEATTVPDTAPDAEDLDFDAPTTEELAADKTVYEKQGKEACGDKTCFKYKIVNPDTSTEGTDYIWFDDDDYLIRKMRNENAQGYSESVYSYDNVSVDTPSPVKELGPNQYIIPGQAEPTTLPSMEDMTHDMDAEM